MKHCRIADLPFCWCLVGMMLLGTSVPAARANLLINGSFEAGLVDPGNGAITLAMGDPSIIGWEIFVPNATIDYVGTLWQASDGVRSVDLDGFLTAGGVQQTFATVPGWTYTVTFDLAGNPAHGPTIKPMRLSADGQSADFFFDSTGRSFSDMGYLPQTWAFVADDTTATLSFLSLTGAPPDGSGWGAVIDNVSVEGVPEPSTFGLALVGLLALGFFVRRRS